MGRGMLDMCRAIRERRRRPRIRRCMAAIFADHAVLQRDRPIDVWGRAQPGEQVTVTMSGASRSAAGGREGTLGGGIAGVPARAGLSAHRAHQQPRAAGERCAGRRRVAVLRAVEHGMAGAQHASMHDSEVQHSANDTHPPRDHPARRRAGAARGFRGPARVESGRSRDHAGFLRGLLLLRARAAEDGERAAGPHHSSLGRHAHRDLDVGAGAARSSAATTRSSTC